MGGGVNQVPLCAQRLSKAFAMPALMDAGVGGAAAAGVAEEPEPPPPEPGPPALPLPLTLPLLLPTSSDRANMGVGDGMKAA